MSATVMELGSVGHLRIAAGVALLKIDAPPVNALGYAVRCALVDGLRQALDDSKVDAIVLACGGRTFFAGADISELAGTIRPPLLKDVIDLLESANKPLVVAMHGSALGGGFELALACHFRLAAASTRVGLPEVTLGLLPGAGGTQRLPRLAGVATAIDIMLFGKALTARQALAARIIDAVLPDGEWESEALAFARDLVARHAPLRRVRDMAPDAGPAAARAMIAQYRRTHPHLMQGFKAPAAVLDAIEAAACLPFDDGLAREAALSRGLLAGAESAAQRHLFFGERAAAKVPGAGAGIKARQVSSVAVNGTGAAASAIIAAFAEHKISAVPDGLPGRIVFDAEMGDDGAPRPPSAVGIRLYGGFGSSSLAELVRGAEASDENMVTAIALARKLAAAVVVTAPVRAGVVGSIIQAARDASGLLAAQGQDLNAVCNSLLAFGLPQAAVAQLACSPAIPGKPPKPDDALVRLLLDPMVAEATRLVAQGCVAQPADIDVATVHALGWPAYRGGLMYWAATQGRTDRNNEKQERRV